MTVEDEETGEPPRFGSLDEIRAEAEHLRLAQEAGGIGTWEWDLATGRMRWSVQMFRNVGLKPDESTDLYRALLRASHTEDRRKLRRALAEFRRRAGPLRLETRVVWPDGAVRWLVFLGKVLADPAGRPVRMRGITIDSTRRREAEEVAETAVRDSERRLRELNERLEHLADERARQLTSSRAQIQAIFDNSPDWLTLFRARRDGRFVYEDMNRATEYGYGLRRERVIGRPLEEILGVEQAQLPLHHMRECIRTGKNQRYTAHRSLAGVTRTVDVMFVRVPEKHDGDYMIMATARDITEHEAMEQQLRQAQKMEAVGNLTGGIAHDFNNLLTAILGNLELLAPRLEGDQIAAKFLHAAERATQNGARLTEQLLAFSRRQHLQPRSVDLNSVVLGMRDLLARTIGRMIQVRVDLAPDLWPALVDPTQIEIAILNLAINSRDAMPLGGTLTIETRNIPAGSVPDLGEPGARDFLLLSVQDSGTGMSQEVLRSAVEPFFTTKPVGKGSGLGLSQVYGMVQQSDGVLRLDSRLGIGTTVRLYLPRAAADAGIIERMERTAPRQEVAGRILVVDDDAGVRETTVQMLRQAGYGVTEAEGGQMALDALARGETYDLIVIDLTMPVLDGFETIRRAREQWPALRALYITGYADADGTGPESGAEPLLKKPFRLRDLIRAVEDAMQRPPPNAGAKVVRMRRRRS